MKIAMLGDIAAFGRYCIVKNPQVTEQLDKVRCYLSSHDVVIANLEAPFADQERPVGYKSAHVKAHPENIELLKFLGITHVTLANNHIGDFGASAYKRTIELLEAAKIGWFGTQERRINLEIYGEKVALHGYCSYNTNPSRIWLESGQALNLLEIDRVLDAMQDSVSSGYLPILAVHSGQEHVHAPSSHDVTFARGLAGQFHYVYYGHHPHVVQGVEDIAGSPIFYSLGNFMFDDVYTPRDKQKPLVTMSEENKTGIVASIEVRQGKVQKWEVMPIYLGPNCMLIGDEVANFSMEKYSVHLKNALSMEYDEARERKISEYIEGRRTMRDFRWYVRRFNINSLGIIIGARRNAKKYHAEFVSKLSQMGIK